MRTDLIDWQEYGVAQRILGEALPRILEYYREDGIKSVAAIEHAMAARDASALVIPAHTLKGESRQFGAKAVGDMAETIEMTARECVETHSTPLKLEPVVAALRAAFTQTLEQLTQDLAGHAPRPAVRRPVFGRKGLA